MLVAALEPVLAIPEEREVVVRKPLDEFAGLDLLVAGNARHTGKHFLPNLSCAVPHRRPVCDGEPHVLERTQDPDTQRFEPCRVAHPRHREVLPGLQLAGIASRLFEPLQATPRVPRHAQDRVNHQLDSESRVVQHHRERVDQERHVVGDDLHDRVRRAPAVDVLARIEHTHERSAGPSHQPEFQVSRRGSGEVRRLAKLQVFLADAAIVLLHEVGQ